MGKHAGPAHADPYRARDGGYLLCQPQRAAGQRHTLDIDDTFDAAHGQQQLTFWNGFHGERGYAPIHVYEAGSGRPVAFILRPARTPSGKEIRGHEPRFLPPHPAYP